ncbi:MAG TPA: ABC transporter permease [Streptosporangiaceae bacterium]|jgi:ABC-2 type transport system permease protein
MSRALHAEWTKLRTVAAPAWLLLGLVALTVAASTLIASVTKCPGSCGDDTTKISLTGVMLGQAAVAGLAVLVVTAEYSTGMIRVSLAATPRRSVLLGAKAAIVTGTVLVAGAVAVLGSLVAGRELLPGNGFTAAHGFAALSLLHGPTLRAAAGSVLYLALIGLFSLGVGVAVRDPAAAIAVVLGLVYVIPVIGDVMLSGVWQRRIERWSPMDAGLAVQVTRNVAKQPIGPWLGLGVLGLWAAGALLIGWLVLRLRDA